MEIGLDILSRMICEVLQWCCFDAGLRWMLRDALYLPGCSASQFANLYGLLDSGFIVCIKATELWTAIFASNIVNFEQAT